MSDEQRWKIRKEFVGDDAYPHEARVEGPPTVSADSTFVEVVRASDYEVAVGDRNELLSLLSEARRVLNPEARLGDLPLRIDAALADLGER